MSKPHKIFTPEMWIQYHSLLAERVARPATPFVKGFLNCQKPSSRDLSVIIHRPRPLS